MLRMVVWSGVDVRTTGAERGESHVRITSVRVAVCEEGRRARTTMAGPCCAGGAAGSAASGAGGSLWAYFAGLVLATSGVAPVRVMLTTLVLTIAVVCCINTD